MYHQILKSLQVSYVVFLIPYTNYENFRQEVHIVIKRNHNVNHHHFSTTFYVITCTYFRAALPRVLRLDLILPVTTIFGAITFYISFFLLYLFLPSPTVQHEVSTAAYITVWYEFFIVLAAFLFGFSDCILQTQLYASIAIWFPADRENNSTFSVYFILQAIGGSMMFALSTFSNLTVLLVILAVANFLATTGLLLAEFKFRFDQKKHSQDLIDEAIQ